MKARARPGPQWHFPVSWGSPGDRGRVLGVVVQWWNTCLPSTCDTLDSHPSPQTSEGISLLPLWERILPRSTPILPETYHLYCIKTCIRGWRDGSEVESTGCTSRGLEFNSQTSHGGSQPSVVRSGALFWHAGIHADRAFIHLRKMYLNMQQVWCTHLITTQRRQRQVDLF